MSSPPRGSPALRRLGAALRRYVQFYGWRAYALPGLIVITIAAVLPQSNRHQAPARRPVLAGATGTASTPDHPARSSASASATTPGSADTPTTLRLARDNTVCQQTNASWQKIPFGSPSYRTDGSHGCVHLPMNEVVWLYQWATIGNTVVTVL